MQLLKREPALILKTKPLGIMTTVLAVICVQKMVEIVILVHTVQMMDQFVETTIAQVTWDILMEQTVAKASVKMGIYYYPYFVTYSFVYFSSKIKCFTKIIAGLTWKMEF